MNKQDESIEVCNCNIIHEDRVSRVKDLLPSSRLVKFRRDEKIYIIH